MADTKPDARREDSATGAPQKQQAHRRSEPEQIIEDGRDVQGTDSPLSREDRSGTPIGSDPRE
jgi:hypothetical protein